MALKCKKATNPTKRPMSVPMKEAMEDIKKINNKVLQVIAKRGI